VIFKVTVGLSGTTSSFALRKNKKKFMVFEEPVSRESEGKNIIIYHG